jgi:hypothetical protein
MGNQREILQREPSQNPGVILRAVPGKSDSPRELLRDKSSFYARFIPAGDEVAFADLYLS